MNINQLVNIMVNRNPIIANLVKLAKSGNTQGVEQFARNMFKEQGRDFDKEFTNFKHQFINR